MFSSIAFPRRAKKILPSQLERAIGLKLAGLSVGPDLWKSRIAGHCQDGGTEHDFQTRCMMLKSGAWRHEHRFHTVFGMPFGPCAAPLRLECNAFEIQRMLVVTMTRWTFSEVGLESFGTFHSNDPDLHRQTGLGKTFQLVPEKTSAWLYSLCLVLFDPYLYGSFRNSACSFACRRASVNAECCLVIRLSCWWVWWKSWRKVTVWAAGSPERCRHSRRRPRSFLRRVRRVVLFEVGCLVVPLRCGGTGWEKKL